MENEEYVFDRFEILGLYSDYVTNLDVRNSGEDFRWKNSELTNKNSELTNSNRELTNKLSIVSSLNVSEIYKEVEAKKTELANLNKSCDEVNIALSRLQHCKSILEIAYHEAQARLKELRLSEGKEI